MGKISDILSSDELAAAARAVRSIKATEWLRVNRPSWDFTPHEKGQAQALASDHKIRVLIPGNGFGKSVCYNALMLTPQGYKEAGKVQVGDEVIGSDGKTQKILGVYPQTKRRFYRITFHDGTSTECCEDHLWTVQMRENRFERKPGDPRLGQWQTLSVKEIIDYIPGDETDIKPINRPAIPMVGPVQFPTKTLTIDPYLFGVYLGNGSSGSGRITIHADDEDIRLRVGGGPNTYDGPQNKIEFAVEGLKDRLCGLGIQDLRSWEKIVPNDYLYGDEQQRRDLLAGLMDTDGSSMGNKDEFSSTSEALADAVVFLVQSLGGRAVKSGSRRTTYTYKGKKKTGRPSWRVHITTPQCPYYSQRKASRWRPREVRINRLMKKIERVYSREGVCFKVSNPDGLFVINDFIVTHNTTIMGIDLDLLMQRNDPFKPQVMPKQLNGFDRPTTAIWFCQKYAQFEIMKPDLENLLTRGFTWNGSKNFWIWPNGSRTFVLSSDSDWSAIQGVEIDAVYFDEHPDRKMWVEMMYRRRGQKKTRYMVAATMTQGLTWFVRDVVAPVEKHFLTQGQTHEQHLELQTHPTTFLWDRGGIHDNPAMDEEDIEHYTSVVGVSEKEMEVRTGGGYADFTGEAVFDRKAIKAMQADIQAGESGGLIFLPDETGQGVEDWTGPREANVHRFFGVSDYRELIQWRPDWPVDNGRITIYEPPRFEDAANYIIGADFAYGLIGKDFDAACVVRKTADGQVVQVAEAQGHWGDVFFAEVLYLLGVLYFEAFIVGERQVGLPCLRRLYDEMGYGYMYYQRREDTRARRFSDLLGHHKSTADTIIPNIRVGVRTRSLIIRSDTTHQELKRYQFRPKNKTDLLDDLEKSTQMTTGAPDGEHDDLVMAAAYAYHGAREIIHYQKPARPYRAGSFGDVMGLAEELAGDQDKAKSIYQ